MSSQTIWVVPDATWTVASAGVGGVPSGSAAGFNVVGRTRLGVLTEPLGATTDHSFVLWWWSTNAAVWSEVLPGSGSLGATSRAFIFEIPPGADRGYVRTTLAAGANVGYQLSLSGSTFAGNR